MGKREGTKMRIIDFENYEHLSEFLYKIAGNNRVACVVLSYDKTCELLRELLLLDGVEVGSICLESEDYSGYNREYYACFDLVKGNQNGSCPGLLESNNEPPYNNLVGGGYGHNYTAFDYKNKEIHIYESLGCCAHQETWAKYQNGDEFGFGEGVKVEKSVHYEFSRGEDGKEIITTYKMIDDTLKVVNVEEIPF